MSECEASKASVMAEHVYKVDKFVVPAEAREEFFAAVREIHNLLREQPGFVRDLVMEKSGGPGEFNMVTLAEWQSAEAFENARTAVAAAHQRTGFNPQAFMARLGVKADMANYRAMAF